MIEFKDEQGRSWMAGAREEDTVRHHGRWYLVIGPAGAPGDVMPLPEIRWQTEETAERTLRTMSEFELRRRLHLALERRLRERGADPETGADPGDLRTATNANAG